jgi:hypothetical protein
LYIYSDDSDEESSSSDEVFIKQIQANIARNKAKINQIAQEDPSTLAQQHLVYQPPASYTTMTDFYRFV